MTYLEPFKIFLHDIYSKIYALTLKDVISKKKSIFNGIKVRLEKSSLLPKKIQIKFLKTPK
jgi:hypothetical protein